MMIKTDNLDEYSTLSVLQNYCLNNNECEGCTMDQICKCMSLIPGNLNIQYGHLEVKDNDKIRIDEETT